MKKSREWLFQKLSFQLVGSKPAMLYIANFVLDNHCNFEKADDILKT